MGHRMLPIAFSPTDPRYHGNETWNKIGYNLAWVRDFCKIFAPIAEGGFRGWAIECCKLHFFRLTPVAMERNLGQNSVCVRDICDIFAPIRGFSGMGH